MTERRADSSASGASAVRSSSSAFPASKLRLRQWIGALELDGVLGGEDGEVGRQRIADSVDGGLALFHGLQQRGLGARRHAVDLIHQQQFGKERAMMHSEIGEFGVKDVGADDVCRHQVGVALHAPESHVEHAGHALHGQGFGNSGHAFDERVSSAKDGCKGLRDQLRLAHDHLVQLTPHMTHHHT
jgi:hypothetical protein